MIEGSIFGIASSLVLSNDPKCRVLKRDCTVPEKIHTYLMEGYWKFLGGGVGGGLLEAKFLKALYENKPEFPGGVEGVQNKITLRGWSMDIFWNCN